MILSNLVLMEVNLTSIVSALWRSSLQLQHSSRINRIIMKATARDTIWPIRELLKSNTYITLLLPLSQGLDDMPTAGLLVAAVTFSVVDLKY
jgi:hypothetical protein